MLDIRKPTWNSTHNVNSQTVLEAKMNLLLKIIESHIPDEKTESTLSNYANVLDVR